MWKVYTEIELPLVFTLNSMEEWGIRVKGEELKSYGEKLRISDRRTGKNDLGAGGRGI